MSSKKTNGTGRDTAPTLPGITNTTTNGTTTAGTGSNIAVLPSPSRRNPKGWPQPMTAKKYDPSAAREAARAANVKAHTKGADRLPPPCASVPCIAELLAMHTYARPSGGNGEAGFIARWLDNMPGMTKDAKGNRMLTVPQADGTAPTVMWSSHTDTVHNEDMTAPVRLMYGDGWLSLAPKETASCLGADCTAGVWLMRQMIARKVPGLYIFHAAEEIGGLGSKYIASKTPAVIKGIKHAIAFDRRGHHDVITHQFGQRTASDAFALAMASELGRNYAPSSGGTFTDTASYADLIPECTNISVGYTGAHSASEMQDVAHLAWLLEAVCKLDMANMPAARDPSKYEAKTYGGSYGGGYDASVWQDWEPRGNSKPVTLEDLVFDHPDVAAAMLANRGVTVRSFLLAKDAEDEARRARNRKRIQEDYERTRKEALAKARATFKDDQKPGDEKKPEEDKPAE